ncbi:uncharacterized protein LOC143183574 [Calliopsis andreniformis]|uniref:uncharacterized protein LOC143183574 n=1 Tax=Calliopsis andreniformis TaxID=337506 RepID=UPI003FCD7F77
MGNSQNFKSRKIAVPQVQPPPQFRSQNDFFETWVMWKRNFLILKKTINENNDNKNKWGNMMLNLMGPFGQDIFSTFIFNSTTEKENIDVLLEKFDEYYIFGTKRKMPTENAYEYINELQNIIKAKGVENGDKLIKQRICLEIDKSRFATVARILLPTFIFLSDFDKLTLREVAFIWSLYDNNLMKNCKRCGNDHSVDKCPALGKQCQRCNDLNHFSRRCPLIFVVDCHFCGGCHFNKKCPAYNETCTKCQKQNHFSWKCQSYQILQCKFCNLSHPPSKSLCPARNTVCSNCHKVGHFSIKCNKTSYSNRH